MKKNHLRLILTLLLAAGLAAAFVFRDTILLYAAPKTVLTGAVTRLYGQLEERFSGSPLLILAESYDPEGRYTAQLQAQADNALLGEISYDMTVRTDGEAHRLYAEGTAGAKDNRLDLSLYMDGDFLAVSSQDLVQGAWYGITYDSFRSDIRSIPLLQYVLSDALVERWEGSLANLQAQLLRKYSGPDISSVSEDNMRAFLAGLLLLPGRISSDQVRLNGVWTDCRRIDYTASSEQLSGIFLREDASVAASFYLYENTLVRLDFYYAAGADRVNGEVFFGTEPSTEPLSLELTQTKDGGFSNLCVSVQTRKAAGEYAETWSIDQNGTLTEIDYSWKADSGDMTLSVNDMPPAELSLMPTESGLLIRTEGCSALLRNLTQEETAAPKYLTMTIQRGADITVPPYKNLDQWSLEDFWKLLGGVGSLFGIKAE